MQKSWCLDLHGVITAHPEFFAAVTQSLVKDGWEITVATGSHIKENNIKEELAKYGIAYTHLFSIADYHRGNKTVGMWYDKNGDPWVTDEDWDRTKAEYCKENNIAMCTDDTARYARNFETPFSYMSIQMEKNKPNKYLNLIIEMFNKRRDASKQTENKPKEHFFSPLSRLVDKHLGAFFSPVNKLGKERKNSIYK